MVLILMINRPVNLKEQETCFIFYPARRVARENK
jgi:hypothetical protein